MRGEHRELHVEEVRARVRAVALEAGSGRYPQHFRLGDEPLMLGSGAYHAQYRRVFNEG